MKERLLYYICSAKDWSRAKEIGYFLGSIQDRANGFIAFFTAEQIRQASIRYYPGTTEELLLLVIDTAKIAPDIRWTSSVAGDMFARLVTRMPISVVIAVKELSANENGYYTIPDFRDHV